MADNISRASLEAARDAAVNCFVAATAISLDRFAWLNIRRSRNAGEIAAFQDEGHRKIKTLADCCSAADKIISDALLTYIAEANAPHNLPGVTMRGTRYTTAHQGAVCYARGMLAVATEDSDVDEMFMLIGDVLTPDFESTDIERESANALAKLETAGRNHGGIEWSAPDYPSQWAKRFGFSVDTLMRRFDKGVIRCKKLSTKSYCIHVDDLPK